MKRQLITFLAMASACLAAPGWANSVVHDAEYYILEAQNGERWKADDKQIDEKLAALRKANGGKPPNIAYILLDDVGFGEIGMPDLEVIRGYKTPNIDALARGMPYEGIENLRPETQELLRIYKMSQ